MYFLCLFVITLQWPIITTLAQTSNLTQYYNVQNISCSSYSSAAAAGPVPFLALTNYPITTANVQANFNNFQFANDNSTGTYLQKTLGYASVGSGPGYLVKSVTSDGVYIYWALSFDLTQLVQNCAGRGVSVSSNSQGRTYFVPVSLLDKTVTGIYQSQQNFYITVPTSGTITISDTAVYKLRGYVIEVTYQQSTCAAGSLKQFITYQYDVQNVYDPSKQVGPRTAADVFLRNPNTNALTNCYGDAVNNYVFMGCNTATATCSYQIQTVTRCRVATLDGNAFNFCNASSNADRIADMGSDLPYPASLDTSHSLYINTYTCPSSTSTGCVLTNQNSANNADVVSATIKDSSYTTGTTVTQSPFTVQAGFLATPTSGVTTFSALSYSNGTNGTQAFDGNLFVGQPVSLMILMPSALQATYDLRLNVASTNFTIYALDTQGNRISNAVIPSIDFTALQNSLLYSPKNTYDNTAVCGASGAYCAKLPACNAILGCDGVSFSSTILKSLLPANGYQFVMSYRIGLPNANGQAANGRTLQSYNPGDDTTADPTNQPDRQAFGQASFTVRLMENGQIVTVPVDITFEKTFGDTVASNGFWAALYYFVIPAVSVLLLVVLIVHFAVHYIIAKASGTSMLPTVDSITKKFKSKKSKKMPVAEIR